MGKVIVEQVVSADGFAADGDGDIGFAAAFFEGSRASRAIEDEQLGMLASAGAIVLGRNTYRMFAAHWPYACADDQPVAGPINALPKFVVSSSLESAPWGEDGRVGILRGDGVEAVHALRGRIDGDLVVWGSLTLSDALLRADAVDVLRLRMLPVLLGRGRGFGPADAGRRTLALERANAFDNGCVLLSYGIG